MGHTPLGYKIENGIAVIDDIASAQVKLVFDNYLIGMSLNAIAKAIGVTSHTGIKNILQNTKYLGDDFYPPIICRQTFDMVSDEIKHRTIKLGRVNKKSLSNKLRLHTSFSIKPIGENFDDPFRQAEYIYAQIESEVH